jgi:alanine racemase
MSHYTVHTIAEVLQAQVLQKGEADIMIEHLCIDSRRIIDATHSVFFALHSSKRNGHDYLQYCFEKGIRCFVVQESTDVTALKGASILLVKDTLKALQQLAAYHRSQFQLPVIGITGSNGKTIVKEWLYQLLNEHYVIARSPKSYNSQIGVPLSVWQLQTHHTLGIFEAGISETGEMEHLASIIQPTIGVFTHLGDAHREGFTTKEEKLKEKWKLFHNAKTVVYSLQSLGTNSIPATSGSLLRWGTDEESELRIISVIKETNHTLLSLNRKNESFTLQIPFSDDASLENALTCITVCLHLLLPIQVLQQKLLQLKPVSLRLELKKGRHGCTLINDSYSADLDSFEIALNVLKQQQQHSGKCVILSDLPIGEAQEAAAYKSLVHLIASHQVQKVIGVGKVLHHYFKDQLPNTVTYHAFGSIEELVHNLPLLQLKDEAILIKGARSFELEQLMPLLEQQVHQTLLEINLSAIAHNIQMIRRKLNPGVKLMGMVKAFSYGSGSYEIANLLQYHGIDYLAVAFTDEGVELRRSGIRLPIMVMNPEPVTFELLTAYNLEPELYSLEITAAFARYLKQEGLNYYPVHIKIDTGMHRLGFMKDEWPAMVQLLKEDELFAVQSVFSHLAAAEDKSEDAFTTAQTKLFDEACNMIELQTGSSFIKHLSNTSGIFRHSQLQYDMVRIGIGMFGIAGALSPYLQEALCLKTTVAQVKNLQPGETVGYNRKGIVFKPTTIATVRIGYADGYPRNLSNGIGYMLIHDQPAPLIGTVCMDMTMLDVTGIKGVKAGDEVIVFGPQLSIQEVARLSQTIAYEIMSGISQRVKRVYFEE